MTTLHLNLPEDLKAKAEARAAEHGHHSIEAYVVALIRSDADEYDGEGPPHLSPRSREELESRLREGLDSPVSPMTREDWDDLHQKLRERTQR